MKRAFKYRVFVIAVMAVVLGGFGGSQLMAQEQIKKEVRVIKPYEPSLSTANKISLLPNMEDSLQLSADFTYEISPKTFNPEYSFRPLKPARMESESISKLYRSYLELGFGTYLTPHGELHISSLRSKKTSGGVYLKHISSYGNVKLDNDEKVFGGYGDTDFLAYGKKIFKNAVLKAEAGVNHDWNHYYGYYNPLAAVDTVLDKDDIEKMSFMDAWAGFKLESISLKDDKIKYEAGGDYHYFSDRFGNLEHEIKLDLNLSKSLDEGRKVGAKLVTVVLLSELYAVSEHASFIGLQPWYSQKKDDWELDLALDVSLEMREGNVMPFFYPKARFEFDIIPEFLTAYVGVDGGLELHSYRNVMEVNPWLVSGLVVEETSNHKMQFSGGFQGSFSDRSAWHIGGSYGLVDDMYFFVNDTAPSLGNRFLLEYDDVQLGQLTAEMSTAIGTNTSLYLKGDYYFYGMTEQARPWHRPDFDLTAGLKYNLSDKILADMELFYSGKRYAKNNIFPYEDIELKGYADINLRLEYRYTKILSGYLSLNNMLGSYKLWNQYPVQGFLVRFGFTYSL